MFEEMIAAVKQHPVLVTVYTLCAFAILTWVTAKALPPLGIALQGGRRYYRRGRRVEIARTRKLIDVRSQWTIPSDEDEEPEPEPAP